MEKRQIKINVGKWEAVFIYILLIIVPLYFYNEYTRLLKQDWTINLLMGLYMAFMIPLVIYGFTTLFQKRFIYKSGPIPSNISEPNINITEEEIICAFPSKKKEDKVRWDEIVKIQILTTDEGPIACDVFLVLLNIQNTGVVIPQDKIEEFDNILKTITQYPDFNHSLFVTAMGSTQVKWFTVWEKS